MHRCLELAVLGMGKVAPNPMVGSVLVHDNKIIGEGYHQLYGEAHAEVNCINSVKEEHRSLIAQSVLYVSLEPCVHFGKTPPCADLIIKHRIPKVIVGCRDPFVHVNGKGIEKLQAAGIEVIDRVLEKECKELNKRFFVFHTQHRPYVILKWAETGDKKMGLPAPFRLPPVGEATNTQYPLKRENFNNNKDTQLSEPLSAGEAPSNGGGLGEAGGREGASRLLISNEYTNRLVHKWRSEEMAILVGTNTALFDNPALTTRLWPGTDPIRIVVDMNLRLPESLKLFDKEAPTIIFNLHHHTLPFEKISATDLRAIGVGYYQVTEDVNLVHQMLNALYLMNIQSVIVEGGAQLLQSFIDDGSWDEARIITNEKLVIGNGLPSPVLKDNQLTSTQNIDADFIRVYHRTVK